MIENSPASSIRVMFSSTTRRSDSVRAALRASTGTISLARPTRSARSARASSDVPGRSSEYADAVIDIGHLQGTVHAPGVRDLRHDRTLRG